jgi:alkylation response protein AidB-like acyl-CoA dehydrogenase
VAVMTDELVRDGVRGWIADNWDPDITLAEWWERLCDSGWAVPTWPEQWFGKGLPRELAGIVSEELRAAGAIGPPSGLGVLLAGPTILTHGDDEQRARYLRPILNGQEAWCQLFSEPGAGSDLASLQCRAERDGDEWIVNGQKVWTSGGQTADLGMLVARTDPDAPKHKGISYLVVDMHAPGVEVRPLRQLTGDAEFNEVFFTDVAVPEAQLIGPLNEGWRVANSTLSHERGTNPRQLVIHIQLLEALLRLAVAIGAFDDALLRPRLAQAYVEVRLFQLHNWRSVNRVARGPEPGPEPGPEGSSLKLYWSEMSQRLHETAMAVLGPAAPLWRGAEGNPGDGEWQRSWLYYHGASIWAGTNEIQRNVIAERTLGLPREVR